MVTLSFIRKVPGHHGHDRMGDISVLPREDKQYEALLMAACEKKELDETAKMNR
jgi:hypothetical protein